MRSALVLLALGALFAGAAPGSAAQLRDCGGYATSDPQEAQRSKNRCLAQAFRQGARATLAVRRGDRNGDVVAEHLYRVLGPRRLELFVDVRKDRLGAQRWDRFVCRELTVRARVLAPRRCLETPLTATGSWSGPRLLNCGRFAHRFEPSPEEQEGRRCILRAFEQGAPAMLVVTGLTIDAGPMTAYYSVLGPRRAERLVDATKERYGIPQWHRFLCGQVSLSLRGSLEFQECRYTVLPAWFPRH